MGVSQLLGARARAAPKSTPMPIGEEYGRDEPRKELLVLWHHKCAPSAQFLFYLQSTESHSFGLYNFKCNTSGRWAFAN